MPFTNTFTNFLEINDYCGLSQLIFNDSSEMLSFQWSLGTQSMQFGLFSDMFRLKVTQKTKVNLY